MRIITVKGTGNVSARPDYIILSLNIEVLSETYDRAMSEAAERIERLQGAAVRVGYRKEDLKTTSFDVQTRYENVKDRQGNYKREFAGYACSYRLKLAFDFDSKQLAKVISAIADCGAQPELSIAFTVKNPARVSEELLINATENARAKAEILCKASGSTLGQLQRLLSQAIDEYKKVNRIMGMEFSDRLKRVVDEYNNRRRDEAFANEVLDDVAEQLAKLLEELKKEKDSFKGMGIDYEEKAFYDILKAVAKKYEFEYPDDKMIELSKRIKIIVDDKAKYTDWSTRDDIKANLQVDLVLLLDEFDYPPVTIDDVYKEVLEQAENFKKYAQ